MSINTLLVVCCILCIVVYSVNGMKCNSISNCGCELEDGSARIDLTPMTKLKSIPMFTQDFPKGAAIYYLDMCRDFDCNGPSRVCVTIEMVPPRNISFGKDLSYEYDEGTNIVTFVYSAQSGNTRITLHCGNTEGIGSLSKFDGTGTMHATLSSKYACWQQPKNGSSKNLSIGSILCITLLVLIVVYIVGGILINKFFRKVQEHDGDLFPNKKMWTESPSLVKDGFMFTYDKIRGGNGEYQSI